MSESNSYASKNKSRKAIGKNDKNNRNDNNYSFSNATNDGDTIMAATTDDVSSSNSAVKKADSNTTRSSGGNDPMDVDGETKNGESSSSSNNGTNAGASGSTSMNTSSAAGKSESSSSKKEGENNGSSNGGNNNSSAATAPAAAPSPPPPVLRGTLNYNLDLRRHVIRGMWNYENSNAFPPQRFELTRTLGKEEDPKVLPKDGEFHGSFSLAYYHTTSKGKQKERSKVIQESGVNIKFTKEDGEEGQYKVDGVGTNQFGVFNINGTAEKSQVEGDPSYSIVLRKRYVPSSLPSDKSGGGTEKTSKKREKKRKRGAGAQSNGSGRATSPHATTENDGPDTGPLPPPSQSYPSHVICLRGELKREQADEQLGVSESLHRICGMWSSGMDLLDADPQNVRGLCNRFEYEHKSTSASSSSSRGGDFPVSGRYFGWFDLSNEDGTKSRINERDVVLKFKKNNAGYYNVEGRGSNGFGKYSITGTLTNDNVITIFRHFQPRKVKSKGADSSSKAGGGAATAASGGAGSSTVSVTAAPPPLNAGATKKAAAAAPTKPELQLSLAEVVAPDGKATIGPTEQPSHGTYSAVSRGVLKLNHDGSHTCTGKWAITREHYNNGQTSNFHFRLEPHFAQQSSTTNNNSSSTTPPFPLDSAMYKGSFQMKRGATKYTSVIDQQIVLKFRKNTAGSYNVYGKGVNSIGIFSLTGTLILSGSGASKASSGHVELYRVYPPPPKAGSAGGGASSTATTPTGSSSGGSSSTTNKPKLKKPMLPTKENAAAAAAASTGTASTSSIAKPVMRRESSRLTKLPSKLEDDDPKAQLSRMMDKCKTIHTFMRDKDIASGSFFREPVDPVAHGIPTYYQIIKEPMDLGTIQRKLDANDVLSPEEYGRLTRLVFENAMTFNVDPTHVVHQAGRNLLILFNQKFREVERTVEGIRKTFKMTVEEVNRLGEDAYKHQTASKGAAGGGKKGGAAGGKRGSAKKGAAAIPKSLKQQRLAEAQAMAAANQRAVQALVSTATKGGSGAGGSSTGTVSRTEFNMLLQMIQLLQGQVVSTYTLLANMSSDRPEDGTTTSTTTTPSSMMGPPSTGSGAHSAYGASGLDPMSSILPTTPVAPTPVTQTIPTKKSKGASAKSKAAAEAKKEAAEPRVEKPLTLKEQEALTETINELPEEKLLGVIQIIRASAKFNDDDEEIDIEIDQLDTATQRKLQRYVAKHIKPPRKTKAKPASAPKKKTPPKKSNDSSSSTKPPPSKKAKTTPTPAPAPAPTPAPAPAPKPQSMTSFFSFGNDNESSDSEDDDEGKVPDKSTDNNKTGAPAASNDAFNLSENLTNDDSGDDDDDFANGFGANWGVPASSSSKGAADASEADADDNDEDSGWGQAREEAEASKARDAQRKAREEKLRDEAEQVKKQRLADAEERKKELLAKRQKEEEEAENLAKAKEREAEEKKKRARERAAEELRNVQQTVDLDAERNIMKQFENFGSSGGMGGGGGDGGSEMGDGGSPSSDFGF